MLLEAVLWVCAEIGITDKPKKTAITPRISNFFIRLGVLAQHFPSLTSNNSWRISDADVAARGVAAKVISLKSYVEPYVLAASKTPQLCDDSLYPAGQTNIRGRRSRRLHATDAGNRDNMELDAR